MKKNNFHINPQNTNNKTIKVGFVLLENFSLTAFSTAVDALLTANLVNKCTLFTITSIGLNKSSVKSDLQLNVPTQLTLKEMTREHDFDFDLFIVCGGYRSSLIESPLLTSVLKNINKRNILIGGLWNGAVALAHAELLNNKSCAIHTDNHSFIKEYFPKIKISKHTFNIDDNYITSADPNSALEMMCVFIELHYGHDTVVNIREILKCNNNLTLIENTNNPAIPDNLTAILHLMSDNIEEPITLNQISSQLNLSRKYIERIFKIHLKSSPSKYYRKIRIIHAKQLLLQSNYSITNISIASGFQAVSHFNKCFKEHFDLTPAQFRKKYNTHRPGALLINF